MGVLFGTRVLRLTGTRAFLAIWMMCAYTAKDERVSIEAFYKGLDYHYRLVKALSGGQG